MPKVIIDKQPIEVPEGTKVIEAAERLGIMIPRFCFHPALGAVGACRVCAVKFVEGPVKGVQMSCMIDCLDGMIISTTDAQAVDFRRHVIEWLMVNHPHDCPVCDEGGHCLLQDMTISGGHGRRRFPGPKRTYPDQYLGPLLQHEMNRCIQCYRCSRFYQEFCGYRDLGVLGMAAGVYFGRFEEGILENPFSGNLADICPTGVFTDKPSRYFGRRWDYHRGPGICLSCSLGCRTTVSTRYRQVARQEAAYSEKVNGFFICDRGRHAYTYTNSAERPRHAMVDRRPQSAADAVAQAAHRLVRCEERAGAQSVAVWASPRCSLETLKALWRLSQTRGWHPPAVFHNRRRQASVQAAVAGRSPESTVALPQLAEAGLIVCIGADPLNEAPLLALMMHQARRGGGRIVCIDPRPLALPFEFEHLALAPRAFAAAVDRLTDPGNGAVEDEEDMQLTDRLAGIAEALRTAASNAVIVCGSDLLDPSVVAGCARLAQSRSAGFFPMLPGPNACGVVKQPDPSATGEQLIEGIEAGRVRSLVVVENDPLGLYLDKARLQAALGRLDLLLVMDYMNSATVAYSHIFLPTTTVYESGGTFINQQGLAQHVPAALTVGVPIARIAGDRHPPRRYDAGIPGSDPLPAALWAAALMSDQTLEETSDGTPGGKPQGPVTSAGRSVYAATEATAVDSGPESGPIVQLLVVEALYGSEELSSTAPQLRQLERRPLITVSAADAPHWDLSSGDRLRIDTGRGILEGEVEVTAGAAAGCLVVPRRRELNWQCLSEDYCMTLARDRIRKVMP